MSQPPSQLDGADVICYVVLNEKYKRRRMLTTEAFDHWIASARTEEEKTMFTQLLQQELSGSSPLPYALAICRYATEKSPQVYLFRCNEQWEVMGDTDQTDLAEALRDAEFNYEGLTHSDWIWVNPLPKDEYVLLGEAALAADRDRPEEDAVGSYLKEDGTS